MEPAVEILFTFQEDIRAWSPRKDEPFSFRRDVWEASLGKNTAVEAVLSELDERSDRAEKIRRSDVHGMALRAASSDEERARQVFVASMMWGYGSQITRYNRMSNLGEILRGSELDSVLRSTNSALLQGDLHSAYLSFLRSNKTALTGIGPAFFTKYLYFAGAETVPDGCPPPLILDNLVARSLSWLLGSIHLYVDLAL